MATLFGHNVRSEVVVLHVVESILFFGILSAALTTGSAPAATIPYMEIFSIAAALSVCLGLMSSASGLFRPDAWRTATRLVTGTVIAGLLLALSALLFLALMGPEALRPTRPGHVATIIAAFVIGVTITRLGFTAIAHFGLMRRTLVVVRQDDGPLAAEADLAASDRGADQFRIASVLPAPVAGVPGVTPSQLRADGVWGVIIADGASLDATWQASARRGGLTVMRDAEFTEKRLNRVDPDRLPDDFLHDARGPRETAVERVLYRCLDVGGSLAILFLTLPLLLGTALAIRLDSAGPVFYRQERVGRHGRVFTIFKFRSMRTDAEVAGAPRWASKRDDRVTRVGRFIRLTRIDEIPQILNVLRGEMALVGPRPERPQFVSQLAEVIPHYNDRAVVKPGITGWAQVNYPYGASVEDARMKLAYDLYYVRRRSLFLDLLILVATIRVILFQEGSR